MGAGVAFGFILAPLPPASEILSRRRGCHQPHADLTPHRVGKGHEDPALQLWKRD